MAYSHSFRSRATLAGLSLLLVAGFLAAVGFSDWSNIKPTIGKVPASAGTVVAANGDANHIKIVNFGTTVYTGPVNVKSTLNRIRANSKLPHDNDGAIWTNSQLALPKAPSGYYHEFVVWPASSTSAHPYGISFPGPIRLVIGKNGETYFSGDHYATFKTVK